ncbi:MAG TPA: Gfo/Idh/MocA family oxidoreductase [Ignavibacteriaceae bacterium]|nr:Gfo/Idh/MocA family oxidoreductase [Ignavibacteriaceae bacterium]
MTKISWGVLSTARIGLDKVIPAMQKGEYSEVTAIASRDYSKAKNAAEKLEIPRAYGSYEDLLKDKEIQAVYIPLPNHLHVEWTLKSLKAGKHVLCEKPITMNYNDALYLQKEIKKFPGLKVMEAFMYRFHPQWRKIKSLIDEGAIGTLKNIHSMFSYYNVNPKDIRNQADIGGGGLLDIGCYCINFSRFIFNNEPESVYGAIEYDPMLKIDRLVSGVLNFNLNDKSGEKGTATFTCSTQLAYNQGAEIFGTEGKIKVEIPFTPMPDQSAKIIYQGGENTIVTKFDPCDQYTFQGDQFSLSIIDNADVPTPFEDAVSNMRVIQSIFDYASNKKHQ